MQRLHQGFGFPETNYTKSILFSSEHLQLQPRLLKVETESFSNNITNLFFIRKILVGIISTSTINKTGVSIISWCARYVSITNP